jgi:two-component system sensor histidine kinase KdpD
MDTEAQAPATGADERERVVVAISAGPESEALLRRGRRIADRAGADLVVVHVLRGSGLREPAPPEVARYRKLAEQLGASYHTAVGQEVAAAVLDFARGNGATQLVLGTSRRSWWARLVDEGVSAGVVRGSGALDVHLVTHERTARPRWPRRVASPLGRVRTLLGWVLALALPVVVTAVGVLADTRWNLTTNVSGYVLATVGVALVGGLGPALVSALVGGVLLNFFFVPPRYTIFIGTSEGLATLITMIAVAVLVALVVARADRMAAQAAQARTEASLLATCAATVLSSPDPAPALLDRIRESFGVLAATLWERGEDWRAVAHAGPGEPGPGPEESDVDVAVDDQMHLALRGAALPAHDRRVLHAAADQAVVALRQQRMSAEAAGAQRAAETARLRTALLSALGHDLRSPLTSIKAALGSLRDPDLPLDAEDTAELHDTIAQSTERLAALVENLLDSSRLATGAVTPRRELVGCDEVVARALSGLSGRESVVVEVDESLPPVLADAGLAERVVANLLDNALKHGRDEEHDVVLVRACARDGEVQLRVVDHGPGLPRDASLFTPLQRSGDRDASRSGVGLGLSVAQGFTEAMGGRLAPERTPGGGATLVLALPAAAREVA